MNTLRQEFCDEINTPMGLDNEFDYIRWLEAKIQALRIHDVVNRRELLVAFLEWFKGYCDLDVTPNEEDIDLFLSN